MNKITVSASQCVSWLLIAVAVYTLYPFIYTGFATSDDFEYFITCQNGGIWERSSYYAKISGRFYLLITMPIHYLFHSFNNITLAKVFHIVVVFLNYAVFAFIVKEIFNNKWIGYLTFLIGMVFITVKGENNPIVSYPFYFSVPFLFIELSICAAFRFYKTEQPKYIYICSMLYMAGLLFYEDYLIYFPLCLFLIIYKTLADSSSLKEKSFRSLKLALPLLSVVGLYMFSYLLFRKLYSETTYLGASVSSGVTVTGFFKVVTGLSRGSYPLFYYFTGRPVFFSESNLIYGHKQDLLYFLSHIKIEWLYKAVLVSGLFLYISRQVQVVSVKKAGIVMLIAFIYIYLPQFLLGITEKYIFAVNEWGTDNYVTTYFAVFPVALLVTLLFILLNQSIVPIIWNRIVIYTLTLFIALSSMINDYVNTHVVADLENSTNTIAALDAFLESPEFKNIPEQAFIYSPQLYQSNSGSSMIHPTFDWSDYVNMRSHKQLTVARYNSQLTDYRAGQQTPLYFLNYGHNKKEIDQFFAFSTLSGTSRLDSLQEDFLSDSVTVWYYSTFKKFSISFYCQPSAADSTIDVNGTTYPLIKPYMELAIEYERGNDFFKPITIKAKNIDLKSVHAFHNNTSEGLPVRIK